MSGKLLELKNDPMGAAISDYYINGNSATLHLYSSQFEDDTFPVHHLFRSYSSMPILEQIALKECKGRVLDVGGGAGSHTLVLQNQGFDVTTIDISPLSITTMKSLGVNDARNIDFFDHSFAEKYDTILMLMNGTGIVGKIDMLPLFFQRLKELLNCNGEVIIDSSDLRYLYEQEDGSYDINLAGDYYGEIDFKMKYKNIVGDSFHWLYIDFDTLEYYANQNDFTAEVIYKGCEYDYLARLKVAKNSKTPLKL